MRERDRRQFIHSKKCRCYGFRSLLNARYLKRMGHCSCDVPMEDEVAIGRRGQP